MLDRQRASRAGGRRSQQTVNGAGTGRGRSSSCRTTARTAGLEETPGRSSHLADAKPGWETNPLTANSRLDPKPRLYNRWDGPQPVEFCIFDAPYVGRLTSGD